MLAKGDGEAGSVLVLALDRGADPHFFERGLGASGTSELIEPARATEATKASRIIGTAGAGAIPIYG